MQKTRLLVTGGCGFIGSNFINYIFEKGTYAIVNMDAMFSLVHTLLLPILPRSMWS